MQEAGGLISPGFHQRRAFTPAPFASHRAARIEGAACRAGVQPWHRAVNLGQHLNALMQPQIAAISPLV